MEVSFYLKRPGQYKPCTEAFKDSKCSNTGKVGNNKCQHCKSSKKPGWIYEVHNGESIIFARISFIGYQLKYYLPEKIEPKYWNSQTKRAKETKKFKEYPEFNTRLDHIQSDIKSVYRKYLNDNNGLIPECQILRQLLDRDIKKVDPEKKKAKTYFGFFQELIDQTKSGSRLNPKTGKPFSKNTVKAYTTTQNNLIEYDNRLKQKIDFVNIDLDFYHDYLEYLIQERKFTTNTVGKHIKIIKTVLNEATERGVNTNLAFRSKRFITTKEDSDNIYLTENEIKEFEQLDLSTNPRLEKVRDLFLIGCHTGLRYSDYSVIKPGHIREGFIHITQFKTKDPIVIPIHTAVQEIIDKYQGVLPKSITNQKTNDYLKELGQQKLPGRDKSILDTTVSKTMTKGGVEVTKVFKKWELLTTHTARRSFATNEYLAGTPTVTIMAITGHRTEKAFLKYIKLTPNEHAKLMKMHWEKRASLKAV